jgi:hypothetical protein
MIAEDTIKRVTLTLDFPPEVEGRLFTSIS